MKQTLRAPEAVSPTRTATPSHSRETSGPSSSALTAEFSLANVRIHRDAKADALAHATHARAVTIGSDIYFRRGEYAPETTRGRELIAHELVHVEQARTRGITQSAGEAAEHEARTLAPTVASSTGGVPAVHHAAAPVMFDRIPDPDLDQDKATIEGELLQRYPYIARLSNKKEVLDTFSDFIRFKRREMELQKSLAPIPEITQGATAAIEARAKKRAPFERELSKNAKKLGAVSTFVYINPLEVLAPDFDKGDTPALRAAALAVKNELSKYKAWLKVERGGFDAFGFGLTPYIGGGTWLPIEADGIHLNFFKRESLVSTTMLAMERAWLDAALEVTDEEIAAFADKAPYVTEYALDDMLEELREERRERDEPTEEERMVAEFKAERKDYAEALRAKTEAAVAPLVLLAEFFAIEGPLDLLLTVAPVHKLGKAFKIGKAALGKRGAKALAKISEELLEHLDDEARIFLKTASKLKKKEVKALKTIFKHTNSQALIKTLMKRVEDGTANVEWIAKKLEKKKIDATFVDELTKYPANADWKTLEGIVEGHSIPAGVRDSFAGKMKGFLGEEAAAKFARAQTMIGKNFRGRIGAQLTRVERGIEYGVNRESLDVLALSEKSEVLVGEVKHLSTSTWEIASERAETLAQLERHNAGIPSIAKRLGRRTTDVTDRVLYVSSNGFKGLEDGVRKEFTKQVELRGWRIEEIPDNMIDDFGDLIDRIR